MKNKSLPKATFVKFRAQSVDFLEVSNPRALLEVALRKFTCLTVGDTICIPHSGKKYFLDVREVQPSGAASIIETDCNVDFEEPLGYKESKYAEYERKNLERRNSSIDSKDGGASEAVRVLQKAKASYLCRIKYDYSFLFDFPVNGRFALVRDARFSISITCNIFLSQSYVFKRSIYVCTW